MENTLIEITFNEYKELLIIKGRYEELKSLYKPSCPGPCYPTQTPYPPTITWTTYTDDDKKLPEEEYRVTLKNNSNDTYTTISGINTKQEDKRRKR